MPPAKRRAVEGEGGDAAGQIDSSASLYQSLIKVTDIMNGMMFGSDGGAFHDYWMTLQLRASLPKQYLYATFLSVLGLIISPGARTSAVSPPRTRLPPLTHVCVSRVPQRRSPSV